MAAALGQERDDVEEGTEGQFLEEGLWDAYNRDICNRNKITTPSDFSPTKPSARTWYVGSAFKNYRRTTSYNLKKKIEEKKKTGAGSAQVVWTDEDMENFLKHFCSWEAQLKSQRELREARKNPQHKDHNKQLPVLVPPHLVKLWQICLAQSHSKLYRQYFGDMSVNRLAKEPMAFLAKRVAGVEMETSDITPVQASLFDKDWVAELDAVSKKSWVSRS